MSRANRAVRSRGKAGRPRDREKKLLRQEVLLYQRVMEGMRQDLQLDDILKLLVTSVTEGLGYDRAGIFLLRPDGVTLDLAMGIDDRKNYEKNNHPFTMVHKPGINPFSDILFGYKKYFLSNHAGNRKMVLDSRVVNHAIVPLEIGRGQVTGLLAVDNLFHPRFISKSDLATLVNFATQAGMAIESFRLHERIRDLTLKDGLTGVFNRRYFDNYLPQEVLRCRRYRRYLALLYVDLDHFKRVNDLYGHLEGDMVLKHVANRLVGGLRNVDMVVRMGGDEFAVILPEVGPDGAKTVAERLFKSIVDCPAPGEAMRGQGEKITVTMGVACYSDSIEDHTQLMRLADESLYQAKALGRNRVGDLVTSSL